MDPSDRSAQAWMLPAVIAFTPWRFATGTGIGECRGGESPSRPASSAPQQSAPPPESTAHAHGVQLTVPPTTTVVAAVRPDTATGVHESVVVPFPSSPPLLVPQHATVPFDDRAQVSEIPAETAVTSLRPGTATGIGVLVRVPMPSW